MSKAGRPVLLKTVRKAQGVAMRAHLRAKKADSKALSIKKKYESSTGKRA